MAMTKAERAQLEAALTRAALCFTPPVLPDVMPPGRWTAPLATGWLAFRSDFPSVTPACSSARAHATGSTTRTNAQGSRELYSTPLLALQALRNRAEAECAERLRRIDRLIEEHTA